MHRFHRVFLAFALTASYLPFSHAVRANPPVDPFSMFNNLILLDQQIQQRKAIERHQREMERQQQEATAVLVRRLQAALRSLGYYTGRIDGNFGSGTQAALAAYQRDNGQAIRSDITEYDIVDVETAARSRPRQPEPPPSPPQDVDVPPVEHTPVTPESAWVNTRFSQADLSQPGPYRPGDSGGWLVVASAIDFADVEGAATAYAQDFPSTAIIKSNNGRHAIVIGWLPKGNGEKLLKQLKKAGIIPGDAFVSSGQRYIGPIWTASPDIGSRSELLGITFLRASPHLWDRVISAEQSSFAGFRSRVRGVSEGGSAETYLSLRKAPDVSSQELVRMPEGTLLAVRETLGSWSRVSLLDGREGWASNKYIVLNDDALQGRVPGTNQPEGQDVYGDKDLQDRLVKDGGELLQDVAAFLKSNPDVPGITAIAESVSQLNTAVSSRDYRTIESASASLRKLLSQNAAYGLFERQRDEERQQQEERAKNEAMALAARNIAFLRDYIPANVTAPFIGELAGLLKDYEESTTVPTRAALDDLNGRLEASIARNDLAEAYDQFKKRYVPAPSQKWEGPQQDEEQLKTLVADAQKLLDQVSRYGTAGRKVNDPIQAARLIVNLKASVQAADAIAIMRDRKALADLLAQDEGFRQFGEEELTQEQLKEQQKREEATREARRLISFIDDYVSRNFSSDRLATLLAAQDKLRASLTGGNGPDLYATVADARQMIVNAGLKSDMDAYRLAEPGQESPSVIKCRSVAKLASWQEALPLCEAALKEVPGNAEIGQLLDGLRRQQLQSEQIDFATKTATDLLDEVRRFSEAGRTPADPLAVARRVSELRAVLGSDDAPAIVAASKALEDALAQDPGFRDFRQKQEEGRAGLGSGVLKEQVAEAQRIRAFISGYVSRNVAAANVGSLVDADATLAAALSSGDVQVILSANEAAREAIARLGAGAELDAFTPPAPPATARNEALAALGVLEAYEGTGKSLAEPLKIAPLVAGLRSSLEGQDEAAIAAALTSLRAALAADTGFAAFDRNYAEERQRKELDALGGLKDEARRIKAFIEGHVSRNVSSPDVPRLLALSGSLDEAIAAADADMLEKVNKSAAGTLTELNLGAELESFTLAPAKPAAEPERTPNEIYLSDRNRPLLAGDAADIVLLFNNGGQAKGVRRDVLGQLVFSDPVSLCWYHEQPAADPGIRMAFANLQKAGARKIDVTGVCSPDALDGADLVMLKRGAFLTTDRAYAKALVDRFEDGRFEIVTVTAAADIKARETAEDAAATAISADVIAGRRAGYGTVRVTNSGTALCVIAGPYGDAIAEELMPMLDPLSGDLPGLGLAPIATADEAFAKLRSGACRAATLPRADLATVITAAQREKLDFTILPLWLEEKDLEALQARLDAGKAARAKAEEDRRRAIEDAAKEEAARRIKLGEAKAKQEADLRAQFGSLAQGLAADGGEQIRRFIDSPAANTGTAEIFPAFAAWYTEQTNAGWELQIDGFATSLADYGTVKWQNRTLDTIFIQVVVGMQNRDLGKYQSQCFLLGAVVDKEFQRYRDILETPCSSSEAVLGDWKAARGYESRWIVQ